MNKQFLSILSAVFSVALGLGLYLYFAQIGDTNVRPVQAVPDNALLILESKNGSQQLRQFTSQEFMHGLLANDLINSGIKDLKHYDSLIRADGIMKTWLIGGGLVTYSLHVIPNGKTGVLVIAQTEKNIDTDCVRRFLDQHHPGRFRLSRHKFMGEELLDFVDFKMGTHFTIAFSKQLVIFSTEGTLVEMALVKLSKVSASPPVEDKLAFIKNSGDGLNLYFNYQNIPGFARGICSESYQNEFGIAGNFAERALYTVEAYDAFLLLKGAAETHETRFQFLDLLNAQAPIPNTLQELLPSGLNFSLTFGYNGYGAFFKNVTEYLMEKNLFHPYRHYIDSMENALHYPFSGKLATRFGNHAALLSIDEPGLWKDSSYLIAVEANDEQGFLRVLTEMEQAFRIRHSGDSTQVFHDSSGIPKVPMGDAFKFFFSDLFEGYQVTHYVNYKGYLFFANNAQILSVLKERWAAGKFMKEEEDFEDFENHLAPGSNLELLICNNHAAKYLLQFLNKDWYSLLHQNMGAIKRTRRTAIQFAGSNDKVFATQACILFDKSKTERTEQIWAVPLDTALLGDPQIIYHTRLASPVILVQDARFQLYQFDREGKLLFKQQLEHPLVSGFTEIDLYGNGKRQWVFNTTHHLFIMDEEGKYLSGWPIWIPTGTHYPVLVLDPNRDRNYQLYVTGKMFKVIGYTAQGRLLSGWNPHDVWPNLKSGMKAITLSGETLMYALNEKGRISYFNLQGKSLEPFRHDSNMVYLDIHLHQEDTGTIVLTALDSVVLNRITYKTGMQPVKESWPIPGYHSLRNYLLGGKRYTLVESDTRLTLLDESGNEVVYRSAASSGARWIQVGDGLSLAWFDVNQKVLKVEKPGGETRPPFPMNSEGPFSLGDLFGDGNTWLIFAEPGHKLNLYRVK